MERTMDKCEFADVCDYFNCRVFEEIPELLDRRKQEYCNTNYQKCARYRIAVEVGANHCPQHLLPHQSDKADSIIREVRK